MKVLLFSNDVMPFGELPTSGGLRCWQIYNGLRAHGIEVIASMPSFTYLAEKHRAAIPEEQREWMWEFPTQDDIVKRAKPDAVIFSSNWDHFNLSNTSDIPLVVDLHGSRLIETSMWDTPVSTERKVEIFAKADCMLCAGKRQRRYFYGWLVQAGRVPESEHFIRYIPISLSPELPERLPATEGDAYPRIVSGGGWFPWQNQAQAVLAVCDAVASRNRGSLTIYGGPHERIGSSAEERMIFEMYERVKSIAASSERVTVSDYISRNELIKVYRGADVALEVMCYNLERELAFTTRTIEYLWCGLPVVYNNFGEIAEHIKEYDAGWAIDPESDTAINSTIEEILGNPELVRQKSANAQQLVRDRFCWDQTITPLLDFLRNPVKAEVVQPAVGAVYARPSFLQARGETISVPLPTNGKKLTQQFTVPSEYLSGLELNFSVSKKGVAVPMATGKVSIQVWRRIAGLPFEIPLRYKTVSVQQLQKGGRVVVGLPLFYGAPGGASLKLYISYNMPRVSMENIPKVCLRALKEAKYPVAMPLVGAEVDGAARAAIALSFVPAESSKLYHLKNLAARGYWMVRRGQYKRFYRALTKRVPGVVTKVRQRLVGAF